VSILDNTWHDICSLILSVRSRCSMQQFQSMLVSPLETADYEVVPGGRMRNPNSEDETMVTCSNLCIRENCHNLPAVLCVLDGGVP
jgi:hypothetical protein